jgi:hypothetical protein
VTDLITSRRRFLTGLGALLVAAPAIVRAGILMPVRQPLTIEELVKLHIADCERIMAENINRVIFGDRSLGALSLNGVEIHFDKYAPADTVYMLSER